MRKVTQTVACVFLVLFLLTSFLGCNTATQTNQVQSTTVPTNTVNEVSTKNTDNLSADTEAGSTQQKQEQPTEMKKVSGTLTVHFIDVGQADSILINTGSAAMLIDAGNNADAGSVVNYIKEQVSVK